MHDKNISGTQSPGIGVEITFCDFYLLKFYQVLIVNIRRKKKKKSIVILGGRKKKKPF